LVLFSSEVSRVSPEPLGYLVTLVTRLLWLLGS